jgi:hypothetical protein
VSILPIFECVVRGVIMTTEQFETWSLYIGITVLISFMFFIIYDLGKKSEAGKFGNFILFLALGLGMVGFLMKLFLQYFLE